VVKDAVVNTATVVAVHTINTAVAAKALAVDAAVATGEAIESRANKVGNWVARGWRSIWD